MPNKGINLTFEFIPSSDGAVPRDGELRQKIRKQAMSRAAATRRQSGNWGKNNIRQYPVYVHDNKQKIVSRVEEIFPEEAVRSSITNDNNAAADEKLEPNRENRVGLLTSATCVPFQGQSLPPSMPSSGYESMRNRLDFDIAQLSALTTSWDACRYRQWSWIPFLPSRYGHYACLDDAIGCTMVRVREWLRACVKPSLAATSLYTRALKSLQVAINDPNQCMKPEVLAASKVLGVYEVRLLHSGQM
ncbi:MAG: hypothetical protein Q9167_004067 [Letrouitia subvulpina]